MAISRGRVADSVNHKLSLLFVNLLLLLSITREIVVSVSKGFLFLWVLGHGSVIYCGTPFAFYITILFVPNYLSIYMSDKILTFVMSFIFDLPATEYSFK